MFPDTFRSSDGLRLSCMCAPSAGASPRARVIALHGLGDHCRGLPYHYLTEALTARGLGVYSYDWRGHGASEGPRMYTPDWGALRDDLGRFIELVEREVPSGPLFLVGLSLGGLLALNHALHHPGAIRGVVAAAPALDAGGVPWVVRAVVPLLSRLAPRISLDPGLDLSRISRDAEAVQRYTADPQFQVRTTPRLAAAVLDGMRETLTGASQFILPILLLHGEADAIVPPVGGPAFLRQVSSPDRTHRLYPGAYHNLFLETNRDEVFADIGSWVEARLG